ncbi:MAG: helix-turn-helix domain-containing protein [Proteobacteria bacterium]|nr:helix-turn-helix domain-containing protein [Pseudomonadota bacterium]
MDVDNASHYLGVKKKTLAMWRVGGIGPRYIKRGRIFYYKEDLDTWLNERRYRSTAQSLETGDHR